MVQNWEKIEDWNIGERTIYSMKFFECMTLYFVSDVFNEKSVTRISKILSVKERSLHVGF